MIMDISLIKEISANELQTSTERAFGTDRADKMASGMSVSPIEYQVIEEDGTSSLLCTATVTNTKSNSKNKCNILFEGLIVADESDEADETVSISTPLGQLDIIPFDESDDVRVRCTCMDFRFRFADINANNEALYGNRPPPYVRKTDTRPPANPANAPGLCKHLYRFLEDLNVTGIT